MVGSGVALAVSLPQLGTSWAIVVALCSAPVFVTSLCYAGHRWYQQTLLLPMLRARMRVRAYRRAYVTIYAVECSREEQEEVTSIEEVRVRDMEKAAQRVLESDERPPRIRVICFGKAARVELMPRRIAKLLRSEFGQAVWNGKLNAAVLFAGWTDPAHRIIVHELTHALIDHLSHGFPYPDALMEGLARCWDGMPPDEKEQAHGTGDREDESQNVPPYWDDANVLSIHELLTDPKEIWQDHQEGARLTDLSSWMLAYLARLVPAHERLGRMFAELRKRKIRTGSGVYEWLLEASGLGANELEAGFRHFCTTGEMEQEQPSGR